MNEDPKEKEDEETPALDAQDEAIELIPDDPEAAEIGGDADAALQGKDEEE